MSVQTVLVVGAGREGKGSVGEIFDAAGWKVIFVDSDPKVVEVLQSAAAYDVTVFGVDGPRQRVVNDFAAYDYPSLLNAADHVLAGVDLIALCIYPEDIDECAASLAAVLERRAALAGERPLLVLPFLNVSHVTERIGEALRAKLSGNAARWFDQMVLVREVIVRRSVGADSASALQLQSQEIMTHIVQAPVNVDLSGVAWLELADDVDLLKDLKIYLYNGPHAAAAYAGHLRGYQTIGEAMQDPEVREIVSGVKQEAILGVAAESGINVARLEDFSTAPELKQDIVDYIARVAFDPIRKLGANERLVAPALFCLAAGNRPVSLARSIANALRYSDDADPASVELRRLVTVDGPAAALAQVSGVAPDHELVKLVAREYELAQPDA